MKYNRRCSFMLALSLFTYFDVVFSSVPRVDFDRLGKVGLVGAFAGLDLANSSSSLSLDPSTSTLLSRSSNGSLSRIGSTNAGGLISSGCHLGDTFYMAGNFSSFASTAVQNIAAYRPSSNVVTSLGSGGPNGVIHAVYCDSKNNNVWVGGSFSSPGSLVAVFHIGSSSWAPPPFGGLSGAAAEVLSISANSSQSSLLFTGSFVTSFQGNQSINGTNNPNVPFSVGATPFSSSLVPVPLQNAQVDAEPSSSDPQFSNVQNILCPTGTDGPGETWFATDGTPAVITVRTFTSLGASGIRLGNTFLNGRGTTAFTLATIPDNNVRTLTFVNPSNGQNETCSTNCPLVTDSSVLYQDFLFDGPLNITGFQLTLSQWQGSGAGLHILQLLSSGAFASAVGSINAQSCYSPAVSNTTSIGSWTQEQANTNIPGTVQTILVATVNVGTPPSQGPSFTWEPYVSASGQYDIYLLVPGCTNFQDCALRTSVKVTVFPGGNQQPWVTTVSQTNQHDASTLIYQGVVVPSSPDFVVTITMTLDDNPEGNGQGGKYELVADRVQLVLTQANVNNTSSPASGSRGVGQMGFGLLEWPLSSPVNNANATNVLPNSTQTPLDIAAFDLYNALGTSALSGVLGSLVNAAVQHTSGTVYLGGIFSLSSGSASLAKNIVAFMNGALVKLPNDGLDGPVLSLLLVGQQLYVGGSFSATVSGSSDGSLSGIAIYDLQQNQWLSLGGGVNGAVTSLGYSGGQVQVAGNFTEVFQMKGNKDGSSVGGFAVWDVNKNMWVNSGGFVVGSVNVVVNGTGADIDAQFIAGNLLSSLEYGASGFVTLATGNQNNGLPDITPLGISLSSVDSQTSLQKRDAGALTPAINFSRLFKKQSTLLASLPPSPPEDSPAVLAGAFWTNTTSSHQVIIFGGNFTLSASDGLAVYDLVSDLATPLPGASVNGTVRALLVHGNDLFVGGEFTVAGSNVNGMAVYNLALGQWNTSTLLPLISSSGPVIVRSLTTPSSQSNVVYVAGSFDNAGSLSCRSICSFNTVSNQWIGLGGGISGDISDVVYAGANQDILIASGSISLTDNSAASIAAYSIVNNTWASLGNQGDLPGPITAVEVNNGNSSSIFVAGRSNDGTSPFLSFWNGLSWASLNSTFKGETNISQLTMVPVLDHHSPNSIIEVDRMLLMSGSLSDSSFGNASSVLFDGQTFIPYLVSVTASGLPGAISGLVHSFATFSFSQKHFLAVGIVILISIAIAAGVVFLLALLGILWTLFSRKDDKLNKLDPNDAEEDESAHLRPSSLLAHVNAATRTTILGGTSPFSHYDGEKEETVGERTGESEAHDPFGPDASNYVRAETPSDAIIGAAGGEAGRPGHARYSFDGAGDGELALTAGMDLEILDDRDQAWWYVRDPRTGQEGVVPAAYLY